MSPKSPGERRTVPCGDGFPIAGGFASLQPEDADYAVEVCLEADLRIGSHVREIRLEPEHYVRPSRNLTTKHALSEAEGTQSHKEGPVEG